MKINNLLKKKNLGHYQGTISQCMHVSMYQAPQSVWFVGGYSYMRIELY